MALVCGSSAVFKMRVGEGCGRSLDCGLPSLGCRVGGWIGVAGSNIDSLLMSLSCKMLSFAVFINPLLTTEEVIVKQ